MFLQVHGAKVYLHGSTEGRPLVSSTRLSSSLYGNWSWLAAESYPLYDQVDFAAMDDVLLLCGCGR